MNIKNFELQNDLQIVMILICYIISTSGHKTNIVDLCPTFFYLRSYTHL